MKIINVFKILQTRTKNAKLAQALLTPTIVCHKKMHGDDTLFIKESNALFFIVSYINIFLKQNKVKENYIIFFWLTYP